MKPAIIFFCIDSVVANGAMKTWHCEMIGRHRDADGAVRESGRSALFKSGSPAARRRRTASIRRSENRARAYRTRASAAGADSARLLVRDARNQSGIFVKRPLPFDQAARDIDGHRLYDVRYVVRLAEDVPPRCGCPGGKR